MVSLDFREGRSDCDLLYASFPTSFFPDIEYLKCTLSPTIEPEFYNFLGTLTAAPITVHAIDEGSVVFPRVPLLTLEGPLIIVQLLETTLLTLVNYAR